MRSTWWVLATLLVVGCSKDPDGVGDDTGDTEDTDDTATDTTDTTDSETDEPEPAVFSPHEGVLFELAQPVEWTPLEVSEPLYTGSIGGYPVTFTVGAQVTGRTDVEMAVDSHLEQETDDDWVQYFTGLKDGGKLDAVMEIEFPLILTFDGLAIDIGPLLQGAVDLPELEKVLPTHIFDTLALSGDSEATTYVASAFAYDWESGTFDPGTLFPWTEISLDFDINYSTVFNASTYDLYPRSNTTKIASQLKAADRLEVNEHVGAAGEEPTQVRFDSIAKGELRNDLSIDATIELHMWYTGGPFAGTDVTLPFTTTLALGDQGKWGLTFGKEAVNHDQVQ